MPYPPYAIAAGAHHSIARRRDGTAWTWGSNQYGQLGDGTASLARPTAAAVAGVSDVVSVRGGWGFSSVLADVPGFTLSPSTPILGKIYGWGDNWIGQLGDGTTEQQLTPTLIQSPPSGFSGLGVGYGGHHSLALRNGIGYGWGGNGYGGLGDGTTQPRTSPTRIPDLAGLERLAAGGTNFSVGLIQPQRLAYTWGRNDSGQLGNAVATDAEHSPVQIFLHDYIYDIAAGWAHALAIGTGGQVWAWGHGLRGCLGNGATPPPAQAITRRPVRVAKLKNVLAVAAGAYFSLALTASRKVFAWGENSDGQLGDGTTTNRNRPVPVRNLTNVVAIACGAAHALAVKRDGTVWAWGWNAYGQLGDGTYTNRHLPVHVSGLTEIGF